MAEIPCFMLEPTDKVRRALRRYTWSDENSCSIYGSGHDASVPIEDVVEPGDGSVSGDRWPHDDPRWPSQCACGYAFQETDQWQLDCTRIWRRVDTGLELTLHYRELPPGAMYWATWFGDYGSTYWQARGGGPHLMVNTPGGLWDADSVASNGPGWEWSGEPPHVTAHPSIGMQHNDGSWRYHGWLRNGVLVDA